MQAKLIFIPASTPNVTGFNRARKNAAHYRIDIDGVPKVTGSKDECLTWFKGACDRHRNDTGNDLAVDCDWETAR